MINENEINNNIILSCTNQNKAGRTNRTKVYQVWAKMIYRCTNEKCINYRNYGGRGIKVVNRWMTFSNFYSDMGDRPDGYSIERIDNDGNYEPSNCKWIPMNDQCRNKRTNRLITYNGETRPLIEWSEVLGIPYYTLHSRLRSKWTVRRAFEEPIYYRGRWHRRSSSYSGVTWHKRDQCWQARCTINGKRKHIGYFNSQLEAMVALESFETEWMLRRKEK